MAPIIKKVHKKTWILLSLVVSGLISLVSGYLRGGYSKDESLFISSAKADVASCPIVMGYECCSPYTAAQCTVQFACFAEGALISAPSGRKPIQDIQVGDSVFAFDINTGEKVISSVVRTFKHSKGDPDTILSPLLKIIHETGEILITDNHWVYRKNDRQGDYANFDRVGMLVVGDKLTLEDGTESAIRAIKDGPEYESVYNFEVEKVHTYFADDVRVHNSSGGSGGGCCGCGCASGK